MAPSLGLNSRALFKILLIACSSNIFSANIVLFLSISRAIFIFLLAIIEFETVLL